MSADEISVGTNNMLHAKEFMQRFGRDMEGWYDFLHDDIAMEFPFGPSVGIPRRIEGKPACTRVFKSVCDGGQVRFSNIRLSATTDPARLVAEYTGQGHANGKRYDQTYIAVLEWREGKLILFREYWDAVVVRDTFGDLSRLR